MITPLLDAAWQSYRDTVIPDGAGSVQIQECRRAFYAGACAVMETVKLCGTDAVSEAEGVRLLNGIEAELNRFVKAVGATP